MIHRRKRRGGAGVRNLPNFKLPLQHIAPWGAGCLIPQLLNHLSRLLKT